jgi:non-heme chloroperoxidase
LVYNASMGKSLPLWVLLFMAAPLLGAGWKEGYVRSSDGIRLHYIEAGSGAAIVFQPGWTMPAEIWAPQIDALSRKFHVVALDPRSQGKSERAAEGHYPERRSHDIKDVIDQLKLAPVVLVGWSLGVPEVLTYVDRFGTGTLRGIVLVDGEIGRDPYPGYNAERWARNMALQTRRTEATSEFVRSMYKTPQSEAYLERIIAAAMSVPTSTAVLLIVNTYLNGGDYRPILAKIDKPLLYVAEPAMREQARMVRERLPSARIELFENAGHALFVDEPDRFNALLDGFVSSLK